jgi:hypothetical protein
VHYTTPLFGSSTTALANALAAQQSPPNVIADAGDPTPPTLLGTNPYLLGMADAILGAGLGFQLASQITLSSGSATSTTMADVPSALTTFTAPVAKTYGIVAVFDPYSSSTGYYGLARISVNNAQFSGEVVAAVGNTQQSTCVIITSLACTLGANAIRIQWRVPTAGYQINVNTNCHAQFFVVG